MVLNHQSEQTVLAIETATKACSAALIYKGVEFSRHELLPQKHAHRILPMIEELLSEADVSLKDVDILAYGEGPGAFTGIRVATGVIQGLALGSEQPVVPVSTLQALAEEGCRLKVSVSVDWCAILDARMSEVYLLTGRYDAQTQKISFGEVEMVSPEKAEETILNLKQKTQDTLVGFGDIEEEYPQLTSLFMRWHPLLPSAISVARLALQASEKGMRIEDSIPSPVYLRNHVADTIEQRKQKLNPA